MVRLVMAFFALFYALDLTAKNYTIGLAVWSGYPDSVKGFKEGLIEEGLIEADQLTFIEGAVGADKDLQKSVAHTFNQEEVDLVYSLTTPGTAIFKNTIKESTPIVFSIVTYPADSGLIESFEYSGNNLVGTSNYVPAKRYVDMLKLILPDVKNIAIFHRAGEPNSQIQFFNLLRLLQRDDIHVICKEVKELDELKHEAEQLIGKVDAFMTTTDTLMQAGGEEVLIDISLSHGIPILSSNKKGIEKGATFGPVTDFYTLGKISGRKAAKILAKGIKPKQLQSEIQEPLLYLVNKKSIDQLNIELPETALPAISWAKSTLGHL